MDVFITGSAAVSGDYKIPKEYMRELRRADPFITYGVLAANAILENDTTKSPKDLLFSEKCGLFLGSSFGPMETNFDILDQVVNNEQTSPTLFSHSVFNAAAGYLSRIFNLQGQALTITDFVLPFFHALHQAYFSILKGRHQSCLVLQIETYSTLLEDARSAAKEKQQAPWIPGACAFLLTAGADGSEKNRIERFILETPVPSGQGNIEVTEKLIINDAVIQLNQPLDAAFEIHKQLEKKGKSDNFFSILSPHAHMELTTDRQDTAERKALHKQT